MWQVARLGYSRVACHAWAAAGAANVRCGPSSPAAAHPSRRPACPDSLAAVRRNPAPWQLTDAHIAALPVPRLQRAGLLFVWVINAKYQFTLDLFDQWGYE